MLDQVRRTSAADIAGAIVLSVASITAPGTELNARAGVTNGALVLVTQNVAGINEWTLYAFDATSAGAVNSPYVVAASGSGQWIAIAGKYGNGDVALAGGLTVGLGLTVTSQGAAIAGGLQVSGVTSASSVSTAGGYTSTVATGTAPFTATSTTACPNLNASLLLGSTWAIPGSIGATTPAAGAFTTLSASSTLAVTGLATFGSGSTQAAAFGNASGAYTTWQHNGTNTGDIGSANQVVGSGATADFGVSSRAGQLVLGTNSTARVTIANAGGVTVSSTLAVTGAITANNSGGQSIINVGDTAVSSYSSLRMFGGSGKYNFQFGAQINVDNSFEITPSTATGGTTFSTPMFTLTAGGAAKISVLSGQRIDLAVNSSNVLSVLGSVVALGAPLRLGNAYVATPQVGTGYVTIEDSGGTTYKVLVAT
jgi:hypothetical protein